MQAFQYTQLPLDRPSLRLLRVLPSKSSDDLLTCEISQISQDVFDANYVALSYVWGSATQTKTIRMVEKGNCSQGAIVIRKNLFDFLVRAREQPGLLPLWIDALCLNQRDVNERNHQVRQMGAVYRNAERVLIWLGEDERLEEAISCSNELIARQTTLLLQQTEIMVALNNDTLRGKLQAGFASLSFKRYWNRMWFVQEYLLAADVDFMSGRTLIESEGLRTVRAAIFRRRDQPNSMEEEIIDDGLEALAAFRLGKDLPTLLSIFQRIRPWRFSCSDPRDRVFALLGLATDGYMCPVDYSLTPSQLLSNLNQAFPTWSMHSDHFQLCGILEALELDVISLLPRAYLVLIDDELWDLRQTNPSQSVALGGGLVFGKDHRRSCFRSRKVNSTCSMCLEFKRQLWIHHDSSLNWAWTRTVAETLRLNVGHIWHALSFPILFESWLSHFVLHLGHPKLEGESEYYIWLPELDDVDKLVADGYCKTPFQFAMCLVLLEPSVELRRTWLLKNMSFLPQMGESFDQIAQDGDVDSLCETAITLLLQLSDLPTTVD